MDSRDESWMTTGDEFEPPRCKTCLTVPGSIGEPRHCACQNHQAAINRRRTLTDAAIAVMKGQDDDE
jgi:hypothetical protein